MLNLTRLLPALFLLLLLTVPCGLLAQDAATVAPDATKTDSLKKTLGYLASDELKGRGLGSEGLEQAAQFIAKQFEAMGLKTDLVNGTPFQEFEVNVSSEMGPKDKNVLKLVSGEETVELKLGEDFTPLAVGGSSKFDAPLVFVGYGISAPKLEYDEYADLDVKGKFVVILRKEPQQSNPHSVFDGAKASQHALFSRKISNAYQQGAAGVIFINDGQGLDEIRAHVQSAFDGAVAELVKRQQEYAGQEKHSPEEIESYLEDVTKLSKKIAEYGDSLEQGLDEVIPLTGAGAESSRPNFPVLFAKRSAFEPLIEKQFGKSLGAIEMGIDHALIPVVGPLGNWKAVGEADIVREKATIRNVIGLIEAPNATSDEVIIIGAHYDHLGMGGSGSLAPLTHEIHNGADDNASGTTALLEVTRRLMAKKDQLRHRILVIAFTGEEEGLLGSAHYVKEPVIPIDKTLMMFNMDMVGRLDENKLIAMGSGTAEMFEPLLDRLNEKHKFELTKDPGGFGPSDHSSFYAKQLPVLALFTGTHNDYHRPSDDADKINYEGMARIIDYGIDFLLAIDKADDRPEYVAVESKQPEMRGGSRPYFGSIPDFTVVGKGYGIQGCSPGSPAAEAGIKGGDILIDLGGNRIGGLEDFDAALRKFKGGDKVEVIVLRDSKEVKLTVTLAPPRQQLFESGETCEHGYPLEPMLAGESAGIRRVSRDFLTRDEPRLPIGRSNLARVQTGTKKCEARKYSDCTLRDCGTSAECRDFPVQTAISQSFYCSVAATRHGLIHEMVMRTSFVQQGVLKVKRILSCFCVAVALTAVCQVSTASAQQASAGNIAVIDIPVIFKNHALFKKQMDELKESVDAAEQALTQDRDQMKKMVEELQGYKAGTPEYKALEERMAKVQADLQVKVGLQKKEFMEREARVYFNTYNQVTQTVSTFAQRHNITLVLRYNSNEIDPTNRQSVLEGVNRPVIYQNQIDITYDILNILNNGVQRNAAAPGSQVPQPRF